jgi:hypothetical protein
MTSSFLVSRLWGTYSGLASSDENARTSPGVTRMYDGLYMSFDQNGDVIYGRLNTDRPFQFKFQPSYQFKWGTNVGLNFVAMSGTLQTTQVTYQTVPVDYKGRGDLGRSPFFNQTDLLISHDIKLPRRMRLSLQANVTNLFDQDIVTAVGTAAYRDSLVIPVPAGESVATVFFNPAGINVDSIMASNNAKSATTGRRSPTYRLSSGFQGSRQVRLFAKFMF